MEDAQNIQDRQEKEKRLMLKWKYADGTVEVLSPAERRAVKENICLRYEFINENLRLDFEEANEKYLDLEGRKEKERRKSKAVQEEKRRKKIAEQQKNVGMDPEKDKKGQSEKKEIVAVSKQKAKKRLKASITIKEASDLAATAMVFSIEVDSSVEGASSTIGSFDLSDLYVNIKREPYFAKDATTFTSVIRRDGDYYTVTDTNKFIEIMQMEYRAAGYYMHPFIKYAINQVIQNPIHMTDGIPGLHAEVLAVNNALLIIAARLGIIVYKGIFENTPEGPKPKQLTQTEARKMEAAFNREFVRGLDVFTHKIGSEQFKQQGKGMAKRATERFAACKNCTNILQQFCNVNIKTGITE